MMKRRKEEEKKMGRKEIQNKVKQRNTEEESRTFRRGRQ